jgi:hypothetical protein
MGKIVEVYKLESLIGEKVIDFIPPMRLSHNSRAEIDNWEVMDRWKAHFKAKGKGFIIMEVQGPDKEGTKTALWSKLEAEGTDESHHAHKVCTEEWLSKNGHDTRGIQG